MLIYPNLLMLAVARASWGFTSSTNDPNVVQVAELNSDVDYRDFNETVDPADDANRNAHHALGHDVIDGAIFAGKKGPIDNMTVRLEHVVFPMSNVTSELRSDCEDPDCSDLAQRLRKVDYYTMYLVFLSMASLTLACLVILTFMKLKLVLMRTWGYSPTLMEDRRDFELHVYRNQNCKL